MNLAQSKYYVWKRDTFIVFLILSQVGVFELHVEISVFDKIALSWNFSGSLRTVSWDRWKGTKVRHPLFCKLTMKSESGTEKGGGYFAEIHDGIVKMWLEMSITILSARYVILQLKYAVPPSRTVTFDWLDIPSSKRGPNL